MGSSLDRLRRWGLASWSALGIVALTVVIAIGLGAVSGIVVPLVVTAALAFLCIRHGGVSMMDFLRYAAAFFFFGQQYYEWRERV